jgi:hypothetical protein
MLKSLKKFAMWYVRVVTTPLTEGELTENQIFTM